MALNWGSFNDFNTGNNNAFGNIGRSFNKRNPSGLDFNTDYSGETEGESSYIEGNSLLGDQMNYNTYDGESMDNPGGQNKLGGLLGKLRGRMTDDEGLFQGGKKGRMFGRVKDWWDDKFGPQLHTDGNPITNEGGIETDYTDFTYNQGTHDSLPSDDSVEPGENIFANNESILGKKDNEVKKYLKSIRGEEELEIDDPTQEDGTFTHGVDDPMSFKNTRFGEGQGWNAVDPYSLLSEFAPGSGQYNAALGGMNYANNILGNFGVNINPSKVDNELVENQTYEQWLGSGNNNMGGGQGWNTGGGGQGWNSGNNNFRQGY